MTNETQTISITDVKIAELREDIAAIEAKIAKLEASKQNEAAIEALAVGQTVSAEYGRAEKRRIITGLVVAVASDDKQGKMLALQVGEGLDVQIIKVRAADVQFNTEATNNA